MLFCEAVAYSEGVRMLKPTECCNCCPLRRALGLGRESIMLLCYSARLPHILRGRGCSTMLVQQLLLPKKSPRPRARVYYAIMLFCETAAYSEGVRVFNEVSAATAAP